jgi:hypothetical protein
MPDPICISSKCKALEKYLVEHFGEVLRSVFDDVGPALIVSVHGREDLLEIDLYTVSQDDNGSLSQESKRKIDRLMAQYLTPSRPSSR